jgi:hypothetical protein
MASRSKGPPRSCRPITFTRRCFQRSRSRLAPELRFVDVPSTRRFVDAATASFMFRSHLPSSRRKPGPRKRETRRLSNSSAPHSAKRQSRGVQRGPRPGVALPFGQRSRSVSEVKELALSKVWPVRVRAALRGSGNVSLNESHRHSRCIPRANRFPASVRRVPPRTGVSRPRRRLAPPQTRRAFRPTRSRQHQRRPECRRRRGTRGTRSGPQLRHVARECFRVPRRSRSSGSRNDAYWKRSGSRDSRPVDRGSHGVGSPPKLHFRRSEDTHRRFRLSLDFTQVRRDRGGA